MVMTARSGKSRRSQGFESVETAGHRSQAEVFAAWHYERKCCDLRYPAPKENVHTVPLTSSATRDGGMALPSDGIIATDTRQGYEQGSTLVAKQRVRDLV